MRESKLYLNFFLRNWWILFLSLILFGALGLFYFYRQPVIYQETRLFQMNYNQPDVSQKISLTDQAVAVIRSQNVNSELGVSGKTSLSAFKPGPLLISLTIGSPNQSLINGILDNSSNFLTSRYPLSELGQDVESAQRPNLLVGLGAGLVVGFFLGIVVALIREYFRNF